MAFESDKDGIMADYKPSELSLGVFEIFGILIPGAALVWLILMDDLVKPFWCYLHSHPGLEAQGWIAFVVAAYIAGQLLRCLEVPFERVAYEVRKWSKRGKTKSLEQQLENFWEQFKNLVQQLRDLDLQDKSELERLLQQVKKLNQQLDSVQHLVEQQLTELKQRVIDLEQQQKPLEQQDKPLERRDRPPEQDKFLEQQVRLKMADYKVDCTDRDLYYWAGSVVRACNPAASQELDRGGAEYKFFRSSVFVFGYAAWILFQKQAWIGFPISIFLALASVLQFLHLRSMNEVLTYQYFLILAKEIPKKKLIDAIIA